MWRRGSTVDSDPDGGFTITFRDVPEAVTEGMRERRRCCGPKTRSN
jgi:hypothetical protein